MDEKSIVDEIPTEYRDWLKDELKYETSSRKQSYYESVVMKARTVFESSAFWQELRLEDINAQYMADTSYHLLNSKSTPDVVTKPYSSFILKTYRHNRLNNKNWPKPPSGGWFVPEEWFAQVNDTVRTCFVVKYLDGVKYLADYLSKRANECGYVSRVDYEAKAEGYYAAHLYFPFDCEVPTETWDTESKTVQIEIQITTQLQDLIKLLLHKHYEKRRVLQHEQIAKWQWDYQSDEFATNYLGHILHYVEGMIMDVRDKRTQKGPGNER